MIRPPLIDRIATCTDPEEVDALVDWWGRLNGAPTEADRAAAVRRKAEIAEARLRAERDGIRRGR